MNRQGSDFVLNAVRSFIGTLFWGPDEYINAKTLILAVTHCKDIFSSVPFDLTTSDRPKTGKSTFSKDIPLLLASNPWIIDRMTTEPALKNKFLDREPPDSGILDDVSKIFGESGLNGRTTSVYQMAVNAYVRTAKVSVSVNRVATDLPAFMVLFMNGLNNAVPADLASRAVQFKLEPKPPEIRLRDALSVPVAREAEPLRKALHRWAGSSKRVMREFMLDEVTRVHPLLTDRLMQIWGPMFAVAHAAGGEWPQRCMDAFLEMALDEGDKPVLLADQKALLDTAQIAMKTGAAVLFTGDLVRALRELRDGEFYREVDNEYLTQDLLPRALGPSEKLRGKSLDGRTVAGMGRKAAPVLRAAADLQEQLYPAADNNGPDAVQQEMELKEVT